MWSHNIMTHRRAKMLGWWLTPPLTAAAEQTTWSHVVSFLVFSLIVCFGLPYAGDPKDADELNCTLSGGSAHYFEYLEPSPV